MVAAPGEPLKQAAKGRWAGKRGAHSGWLAAPACRRERRLQAQEGRKGPPTRRDHPRLASFGKSQEAEDDLHGASAGSIIHSLLCQWSRGLRVAAGPPPLQRLAGHPSKPVAARQHPQHSPCRGGPATSATGSLSSASHRRNPAGCWSPEAERERLAGTAEERLRSRLSTELLGPRGGLQSLGVSAEHSQPGTTPPGQPMKLQSCTTGRKSQGDPPLDACPGPAGRAHEPTKPSFATAHSGGGPDHAGGK